MQRSLEDLWYRQPPGHSWLTVLARGYGAVMSARRGAYARGWLRPQHVGAPVIVVGNLTVGGTGKTPLVIWLASELGRRGLEVGIVSRGYGRHEVGPRLVEERATWRAVGDEPLILHRRTGCPTAVAADRAVAAGLLVVRGAEVILADDGLQHLRLARQCEIVVIDGARGFGNGRMLPAGPLREGIARLGAADAVVVNGRLEHESLRQLASLGAGAPLSMRLEAGEAWRLDSTERAPLERFRARPVHAVAGIGNPQRFFRELRARGLEPIEHPYPDHHPLTAPELDFGDDLPVLMTEKDAVKCAPIEGRDLWYVPVEAQLPEDDARRLIETVMRRIESFPSSGG